VILPDPEARCGWEGIWPSTAACVSVTQRVDLRQLPLGPVGEVWSEQVQRVFFDKEAERAELLKETLRDTLVLLCVAGTQCKHCLPCLGSGSLLHNLQEDEVG
jgi:hypothetical protein